MTPQISGSSKEAALVSTALNNSLGALLIVIAFFLVAVMSALGKMASQVAPTVLVFFQSALSLLFLSPLVMRRGFSSLKTARPGLHFVRALGGALSQGLMFFAIKKMPLMNAVLLSNSAPLFIPLIAAVWLKIKIKPATWLSVTVGFVGVVLILKPDRTLLENPASLFAAMAAVSSALALVCVNHLSSTETTERILFYYFFFSTLLTAPFLVANWQPLTPSQWIDVAGIGTCMALAQFFIVQAYRYAAASVIAPFNYSVVVFSAALGWLLWRNVPDEIALWGTLFVCLGGIISTVTGSPGAQGHLMWPGHLNLHFRFSWLKLKKLEVPS